MTMGTTPEGWAWSSGANPAITRRPVTGSTPSFLPPVKPFDPTLLLSALRGWIVDIAECTQCLPDFPAVASMVALSGILGRKIVIRPTQKDNWTVYPNLWGMLIGRPSLMKSPPGFR